MAKYHRDLVVCLDGHLQALKKMPLKSRNQFNSIVVDNFGTNITVGLTHAIDAVITSGALADKHCGLVGLIGYLESQGVFDVALYLNNSDDVIGAIESCVCSILN